MKKLQSCRKNTW